MRQADNESTLQQHEDNFGKPGGRISQTAHGYAKQSLSDRLYDTGEVQGLYVHAVLSSHTTPVAQCGGGRSIFRHGKYIKCLKNGDCSCCVSPL